MHEEPDATMAYADQDKKFSLHDAATVLGPCTVEEIFNVSSGGVLISTGSFCMIPCSTITDREVQPSFSLAFV